MDSFKKDLDIFPTSLAVPAWQDMLAHLKGMKKQADFDRKASIPALTEFFTTVLNKVKSEFSAIQENEQLREETLAKESEKLVELMSRYQQAEVALEMPLPGLDISQAQALARELVEHVQEQEWVIDMLDGADAPADTDMGDDPIVDNLSFVEV